MYGDGKNDKTRSKICAINNKGISLIHSSKTHL